jgi:hypothetical protein
MNPALETLLENIPHANFANVGSKPELKQNSQQVLTEIIAHLPVLWQRCRRFGLLSE